MGVLGFSATPDFMPFDLISWISCCQLSTREKRERKSENFCVIELEQILSPKTKCTFGYFNMKCKT